LKQEGLFSTKSVKNYSKPDAARIYTTFRCLETREWY